MVTPYIHLQQREDRFVPICSQTYNTLSSQVFFILQQFLRPYDDIVDGYMNELDKEADEAHDCKPNGGRHGNLLKFFAVWFRASLDETNRILSELLRRFNVEHYLIHS